jgi:hypothetical protein
MPGGQRRTAREEMGNYPYASDDGRRRFRTRAIDEVGYSTKSLLHMYNERFFNSMQACVYLI